MHSVEQFFVLSSLNRQTVVVNFVDPEEVGFLLCPGINMGSNWAFMVESYVPCPVRPQVSDGGG